MTHQCVICKVTDEQDPRIGFHPRLDIAEVCDNCAEEYGCACGCYPSPGMVSWARYMGVGLYKDDYGKWQYEDEGA